MICILDCRDIADVGYAAINNCDMIYCRIHDVNGEIMLYKKIVLWMMFFLCLEIFQL